MKANQVIREKSVTFKLICEIFWYEKKWSDLNLLYHNNSDKYSCCSIFKELYANYTVQLNSSGKNVHEFHVLKSIW